ncbi:ABC transporter substrate-binding protein [Yinghuangia sp. YIM S09857]|uniref:ABC transporter substrate-binding protein n=1 Tax=Yinghuangia sp. YIM S09857 TaxID=3436929 RepID=UPI003F52BE98
MSSPSQEHKPARQMRTILMPIRRTDPTEADPVRIAEPNRQGNPPPARASRTPRRRLRGLAAGAVALLLALAACGDGDDTKPTGGQSFGTEGPRMGGSLSMALVADSRGLDPFTASLSSATDYSRMNALYDQLLWVEPGGTTAHPKIAEAFTTPDGGKTWVLKVRPGVTFSDGTPYDAAAVKFTWDRHADPAARSPYATSMRGVSAVVEDPLTLRITLDQPNTRFDQIVAAQLGYVVSPTAYRADPQGFGHKPVGAGPFVLKEWVQGSKQTYVRNPSYWQQGKPRLDELVIRVSADQQQSFNSVSNGSLDFVTTVDDVTGSKAAADGFDVQTVVVNGSTGVQFNSAKAPFDDPRARRALSLAISRDDFNKVVYDGAANPADGLFAEKSPLIDHAAVPKMDADRAEAERLARQLADEGKPIDFTLTLPQSPLAAKTGEYLQAQWNALPGVAVRVESVAISALSLKVLIGHDYQAVYYGIPTASGEPNFWNTLLTGSPNNHLGFSSAAVDAALRDSRASGNAEELKAAYTRLAQAVAADVPLMPLIDQTTYSYAKPGRLAGFRFADNGSILLEELGLKS